jgi:GT2 family glycosyltransferase
MPALGAVPVQIAPWRIRAVIPCFNRRRDVELLLADLAALNLGGRAALSVMVVDNASDAPLADIENPPSLSVEHFRLEANVGGSGGFNAGMARILSRGIPGDRTELVWILDSDVRVEPGALGPLIDALEGNPGIVAVGSALVDPQSRQVFECGGRMDRGNGEYDQRLPTGWEREAAIPAEYLAACSMLVRREAIERAGLMADLFVSGDDVEWSLRLARRTGGSLVGVPASRVRHSSPDRMRTWARYYAARNAFAPLAAAGAGALVRFRRALREVARAVSQAMLGRDDLAELHLRGLADAKAGVWGAAPGGTLAIEGWTKPELLPATLRRTLSEGRLRGRVMLRKGLLTDQIAVERALNAACVGAMVEPGPEGGVLRGLLRMASALIVGPRWGLAVVSARAKPGDWLCARTMVSVAPEGFVVRRVRRWDRVARLSTIAARGLWLAAGLGMKGVRARPPVEAAGSRPLTVSVVVLSCNRWQALERTLAALSTDPALSRSPVIIADNASTDGTRERLADLFPDVKLVALTENRGVAGFNRAVEAAATDAVLILDDDACPEPGVLSSALEFLARRPDLGAVALHPRHPQTKASEWRFGEGAPPCDDWPVMGCGNLVRRDAWERVGGYEEAFFLYRNDTDLAMKLLEAGYGVHFNPEWVVWHDSPVAAGGAKKSARWFGLATRNWVWACRRHGRGFSGLAAALMGWLWAHKLAGFDPARQWKALSGFVRGCVGKAPPLPPGLLVDGAPIKRLLGLRFGRK